MTYCRDFDKLFAGIKKSLKIAQSFRGRENAQEISFLKIVFL